MAKHFSESRMKEGRMQQRKLFGTALAVLATFSICGALPGITANTAPLPEQQ